MGVDRARLRAAVIWSRWALDTVKMMLIAVKRAHGMMSFLSYLRMTISNEAMMHTTATQGRWMKEA